MRVLTERMDPVKASPFDLGGGDDAVLLVHGFTGSPWDMRPLGEALADRGFFARGILLPGHGQSGDAMLGVRAEDWEHTVHGAVDALSGHRKLFLAGLSMGALLSVLAAVRKPERISGLALLAPAMRLRNNRLELLRRSGKLDWFLRLQPWVKKDATDIADPVALKEAPLMARWPTRRLLDLFALQHRARQKMHAVKAPSLVMVAQSDHVVTPEGGEELARGLRGAPTVKLVRVEDGFHIMPRDFGRERVAKEVCDFFDALREG